MSALEAPGIRNVKILRDLHDIMIEMNFIFVDFIDV